MTIDLPSKTFSSFHLLDEEDNLVPFQIEGEKLVFVAKRVPAFGWKTYWMIPEEKAYLPQPELYIDGEGKMESPDYLLWIDPSTGVITRLYDKKARERNISPLSFNGRKSSYLCH